MDPERERQRLFTVRFLRLCGWSIALMGIIGLVMFYFDIAESRKHPVIVTLGTAFCIFGSLWMFGLAAVAKNAKD
jgi:hypothetical protein